MKLFFLILFVIFTLFITNTVMALESVLLDLNIESSVKDISVTWSSDSEKVAVYTNSELYIIGLDSSVKLFVFDYNIKSLEWLDEYKIILGNNRKLEIFNLIDKDSYTYELEYLFMASNIGQNGIVFSTENSINTYYFDYKIHRKIISNIEPGEVFYNKEGCRFFFTYYAKGKPYLYTFDFSNEVFDLVSEDILLPFEQDKTNDLLYCYKISDEKKEIVFVDLLTLRVSDYEPLEDIVLKGINIDLNFKNHFDYVNEIAIFLSPDKEKAFVFEKGQGEIMFIDKEKRKAANNFYEDNNVIYIRDENLEKAIRSQINKPTGKITIEDTDKLLELDVSNKNIKSIEGLEYFIKLKKLDISKNPIKCIEPLSNMRKLEVLTIGDLHRYSRDINIFPIKNNNNLRELNIRNINLDVEAVNIISNFSYLRKLNLHNTSLDDINFLFELNELEEFTLGSNYFMGDITALSKLENLERLNLNMNRIQEITPLINLKKLKHLVLQFNNIEDISPLENLVNLEFLSLAFNPVKDISVLSDLSNLEKLHLSGNYINFEDGSDNFITLEELKNRGVKIIY
ncbi:leucine-rich repeat domain-containing protein [Natronospora cellulosivora (SeqCode)]